MDGNLITLYHLSCNTGHLPRLWKWRQVTPRRLDTMILIISKMTL